MTAPETIKSAAELIQSARKVYGTNGRGVPYDLPRQATEWWRAGFDPAACLRQIKIGVRDGKSLPEIDKAASAIPDTTVLCPPGGLDAVDVGSLEVGFQRTFGKFDSALPEFAKINGAAYWDYQRSKVYREPTRPSGGLSENLKAGAKTQRSKRR